MAILTASGKTAYQEAMFAQSFHLAWGTGSGSWGDSPPAEDLEATGLLAEVGRRAALEVQYVVPDVAGTIELSSGNYTLSGTPTRNLLLHFHFDFADASDQTIREVGVFINTVPDGGVPGGQMYLTPAEVSDPGTLLLIEHQGPAIVRSPAVRERFRYVVTL